MPSNLKLLGLLTSSLPSRRRIVTTASCQTNMSPKYYNYQLLQPTKMNFEHLSGQQVFRAKATIPIRFNLLLLPPPSFVFAALFIPSLHVLSSYIYVSLSLVTVSPVWDHDKFCPPTPPLGQHFTLSEK